MTTKEIENKIGELQAEINNLKNILELDYDEIFLLSIEEYKRYKDEIPLITTWWWLRSPGNYSFFAASVHNDGSVYYFGYFVDYDGGCVRPALRFANLKSKITKSTKGDDYFVYNETRWKIIDKEKEIAIAELPIGFEKFDSDSNDYINSYIRQWLLDWKG